MIGLTKRIDLLRSFTSRNGFCAGLLAAVGLLGVFHAGLMAQDASPAPSTEAPASDDPASDDDAAMKRRYEAFEKLLSGAKLIGSFTITGREGGDLNDEEYFISRVTKSTEGDYWVFNARIKYGDKDYTVPLPLEVKWAGDTPVVTLTDLTILGQGPFSARVVFHDGKYAGTWSHGEVGGHLFGRIESRPEMTEPKER